VPLLQSGGNMAKRKTPHRKERKRSKDSVFTLVGCQATLQILFACRAEQKLISVIQRWQRLQHFDRPGPIEHGTILVDFAVTENQHTFGKLRDVVFVGYEDNR
jgi:hypothetical protein